MTSNFIGIQRSDRLGTYNDNDSKFTSGSFVYVLQDNKETLSYYNFRYDTEKWKIKLVFTSNKQGNQH